MKRRGAGLFLCSIPFFLLACRMPGALPGEGSAAPVSGGNSKEHMGQNKLAIRSPKGAVKFEGFGADTNGGEGYPTLIASTSENFARIIDKVAKTGGNAVIYLVGDWTHRSSVKLSHLENVTLDGMNARVTFDGITLYVIDSNNIVLRGLRIRNHQKGDDAIQINSSENVVVDHCSVSEAGDGNIDITGLSKGQSKNITVSWTILANTFKQSLVKYNGPTNISFHHNLYYNSGLRTPHVEEGVFDFRNNVIWQWSSTATALQRGARMNIVNNFYEQGDPGRGRFAIFYRDSGSKAWIDGNVFSSGELDTSRLSRPIKVPPVTTQGAKQAKTMVLDQAGAMPRDVYDEQLIENIRNNIFPKPPPVHE